MKKPTHKQIAAQLIHSTLEGIYYKMGDNYKSVSEEDYEAIQDQIVKILSPFERRVRNIKGDYSACIAFLDNAEGE